MKANVFDIASEENHTAWVRSASQYETTVSFTALYCHESVWIDDILLKKELNAPLIGQQPLMIYLIQTVVKSPDSSHMAYKGTFGFGTSLPAENYRSVSHSKHHLQQTQQCLWCRAVN